MLTSLCLLLNFLLQTERSAKQVGFSTTSSITVCCLQASLLEGRSKYHLLLAVFQVDILYEKTLYWYQVFAGRAISYAIAKTFFWFTRSTGPVGTHLTYSVINIMNLWWNVYHRHWLARFHSLPFSSPPQIAWSFKSLLKLFFAAYVQTVIGYISRCATSQ